MKQIGIINDENFNLKLKKLNNPQERIGARGIVIREDGKIALFNKTKKNEYKLPGGGVEKSESIQAAFQREVLEETGYKIKDIKQIGIISEIRSLDNFKQISHVFVAKIDKTQKKSTLNLTKKEREEGGQLIWTTEEEALRLISESIDNLKASKYENLYHSRFIALRDKTILEYYLRNNNKWNNLYKEYINTEFKDWDSYFKTKMKLKKKFIKLILKYSKNGKPILECGCGTAKTSIYLSTLGLKTYAIDIETDMVSQAKKLSKEICSQNLVNVLKGDIAKIPFDDKHFSVTHSSGVLEHYSDDKIIEFINEQIRVSDFCIFSVPTSYFEKKMLGNERFLSRKKWRKIISKSNAQIIKETGYHYKKFGNRLLDVLKKPKRILKPIALYVFVLKEGEIK